MLDGLTEHEAKVLRLRFGIDMNTAHTLEEVGKHFDVSPSASAKSRPRRCANCGTRAAASS